MENQPCEPCHCAKCDKIITDKDGKTLYIFCKECSNIGLDMPNYHWVPEGIIIAKEKPAEY